MSLFPSPTITFEAALRDLASSRASARTAAAQALGDVRDATARARAARALIEALTDSTLDVRLAAVTSLGELACEVAIEPLVRCFDDPAPAVRQGAAVALGRLGFSAGFEALVRALRSGPPDLRFQAATSLAEIDAERAREPLIAALTDADSEVVGAAACALGAVGDPLAIEPLAAALQASQVDKTRFDVAYALADLGDARGAAVLRQLLVERDYAFDAVDALERIGDRDAAPALEAVLDRVLLGLDIKLRAAGALLALAPVHSPMKARETLLAGLRSRRVQHRGLAVQMLSRIGGEWARGPLEELRQRRGGRMLSEEIDEALASIRVRSTLQ